MEDSLVLGGNITLVGFSNVEPAKMIVLKKIIGNYTRKFSDKCNKLESLTLTLKSVHGTESSNKFHVNTRLIDNGNVKPSEAIDYNLFVAIDSSLKKIEASIR